MGLAIFYETLLVILVSALTAAVCLSSYLVTKRKTMLFACIAFMFYFFDVASILQDDYAARELASGLTQEYYFIRSLYTMVTGAGFLGAFWFMVCEYIGECRRSIRITPIVVYAALSLILLAISGESKVLRFCYYSCRAAFMFWILAYGAVHYLRTKDQVERQRLGRATRTIASLSPCSEWSWWPRTRCSSSCCPPTQSPWGQSRCQRSATTPRTCS